MNQDHDSNPCRYGTRRRLLAAATLMAAITFGANFADAEMNVLEEAGFKLNLGFEAGGYYARGESVNFGTRQVDLRTGDVRPDPMNSFETFLKASISGSFDNGSTGMIYGGADGTSIDTQAWHLEAGYTFSKLPWSPTVAYRFTRFSGEDPVASEIETFDPLLLGYNGDWGAWFPGESTGAYLLFHSNPQAYIVHPPAPAAHAIQRQRPRRMTVTAGFR